MLCTWVQNLPRTNECLLCVTFRINKYIVYECVRDGVKLGVRRSFTALLMKLVCVCLFVRPCLCAFFCLLACSSLCVCVSARLFVYVCLSLSHFVRLCVCVSVCMCMCICMYLYVCVFVCVCVYAYARVCVHTQPTSLKTYSETMRARIVHTHTQITRHCIIIKAHTP